MATAHKSETIRQAKIAAEDWHRKRSRRAVGQYGLMEDERDPHDNYETPPDAVHQLLSNVKLKGAAWDPSCGRGNIVKAFLDSNHSATGSDKYKYFPVDGLSTPLQVYYEYDFMRAIETEHNIVMNPPFSASDEHVRHALQIIPRDRKVCVLLRLTWIAAKKRADLLEFLDKIIICGRLRMLPPDVKDQGHGGAVDFAWFVFMQRPTAATVIVRAK